MKYRKLGNSDLNVSEISLGSWLTYGGGVQKDRATACVNRALDLGVNLFDTANAYGGGAAESFLGETLTRRRRDSYVLATKVYFPMSEADEGLSRTQILKQIDASLKRLRVEYVDLYQCHRYDVETPLEETMSALTKSFGRGKLDSSASASGRPSRSRLHSRYPESNALSQVNRNTRCSGGRWRTKSFPCAARNMFRKSSGLRLPKAS